MQKAVERLRAELATLVTAASQQDAAAAAVLGRRRGDARPAAWARREDRRAKLEAARRRLAAQAQAAAEAARARRAAAAAARSRRGPQRRGKVPTPLEETPDAKAQPSFTAPELPSMRPNTKGGDYWGNAPASVDGACPIILACAVTDATHDQQPAAPLAPATLALLAQAGIEAPKDAAGHVLVIPAPWDKGYDSEGAVPALEACGCAPSRAPGRQLHPKPAAAASAAPPTAKERRAAQERPPAGRALYARRKVIAEPVLGPVKEPRGCRRFLLRGLPPIRGAWRLVCLPHNLLNIWRHGWTPMAISQATRSL
jgi:hypothetical protein